MPKKKERHARRGWPRKSRKMGFYWGRTTMALVPRPWACDPVPPRNHPRVQRERARPMKRTRARNKRVRPQPRAQRRTRARTVRMKPLRPATRIFATIVLSSLRAAVPSPMATPTPIWGIRILRFMETCTGITLYLRECRPCLRARAEVCALSWEVLRLVAMVAMESRVPRPLGHQVHRHHHLLHQDTTSTLLLLEICLIHLVLLVCSRRILPTMV
mmetsp:Transcript_14532/g.30011  ORF Transcript_14532/g.30011 Transcript_14532/m.30011 type:complete len:216 (-) Transcript_14532:1067-1714(-)